MKTTSVAYLALAAVAHAHPTVPPVATAGHGMGSGHLNVEIATEAVANEESALPMPTGLNVAACDALTDAYTCQELAACCKDGPTCTAAAAWAHSSGELDEHHKANAASHIAGCFGPAAKLAEAPLSAPALAAHLDQVGDLSLFEERSEYHQERGIHNLGHRRGAVALSESLAAQTAAPDVVSQLQHAPTAHCTAAAQCHTHTQAAHACSCSRLAAGCMLQRAAGTFFRGAMAFGPFVPS